MVALIAEQYPGRTVAALDIGAVLAYGGGGIHCITQQVPALYVSGLQGG
jgi:agmatine deiminase